jgi:SAM-dependent methyltransferase
MDDVTTRVQDLYSRFPYPSQDPGEQRLKELANLFWLFARETSYDFRGKRVLDVGTGTGHRVITAARLFPETRFVAVDLCAPPLAIARATAEAAGVTNVEFHQHDLMDDAIDLGRFDVVLCMGVLHHLADPGRGLRQVARHVADDGVAFLYVYGERGSRERMRRKEVISRLLRADGGSFEAGIKMAKDLGFDTFDFGWTLNVDDPKSVDALIVDSYLHVNEHLFDTSRLHDVMTGSGFHAFMAYGITCQSRGYLFDTARSVRSDVVAQWTDMVRHLPSPELASAYDRLDLKDKYRLVELMYEPNGYTLLAYKADGARLFPVEGRVRRNALAVR